MFRVSPSSCGSSLWMAAAATRSHFLLRPVEPKQYTSAEFRAVLTSASVRPSMGRVGSCYDNAVVESFFATLKTEIGTRFWATHDDARRAVFTSSPQPHRDARHTLIPVPATRPRRNVLHGIRRRLPSRRHGRPDQRTRTPSAAHERTLRTGHQNPPHRARRPRSDPQRGTRPSSPRRISATLRPAPASPIPPATATRGRSTAGQRRHDQHSHAATHQRPQWTCQRIPIRRLSCNDDFSSGTRFAGLPPEARTTWLSTHLTATRAGQDIP